MLVCERRSAVHDAVVLTERRLLVRVVAALLRHEAEHYEEVAISVLKPTEIERMKLNLVRIYEALDVLEAELVAPAPGADET